MNSVNRRTVIWWGGQPPRDISRELNSRNLTLVHTEEDDAILRRDTRAVLLPHYAGKGSDAIRARARRLSAAVGDRGGTLFVVGFGETDRQAVIGQTAELPDVPVLDGTIASEVAEACARLDVGPSPGDGRISLVGDTVVGEQDELLLQRAFSEFREIRVEELQGGLSGARVWSVEAVSADGRRTVPFLVKADSWSAVTSEIQTMQAFVLDHLPYSNHPGLIEHRCVSGADRRLLVSHFVDGATRLDHYLTQRRPVATIAAALFHGAMRRWRMNEMRSRVKLGADYERRVRGTNLFHDRALFDAYALAKSIDPSVASPMELLAIVRRFPEREIRTCQAHGDLHPRNVFVREVSEIVLIDFAHAGDCGSPIVRDAATLDVALAFDGWARPETRVSVPEIESLYTPPLFGLRGDRLCHRASLIPFVRSLARDDVDDPNEYTLAVVAMLLRTSRLIARRNGEQRDRAELTALALRAAERLTATLP